MWSHRNRSSSPHSIAHSAFFIQKEENWSAINYVNINIHCTVAVCSKQLFVCSILECWTWKIAAVIGMCACSMLLHLFVQRIPTELSDLEQTGELGHGTCGHVVKMRHIKTGHFMAVKVCILGSAFDTYLEWYLTSETYVMLNDLCWLTIESKVKGGSASFIVFFWNTDGCKSFNSKALSTSASLTVHCYRVHCYWVKYLMYIWTVNKMMNSAKKCDGLLFTANASLRKLWG